MPKHYRGALPLFLCLAVSACDGSPTDPPANELTNAEIEDVAKRVRVESMMILSVLPLGYRFNVLACNPEGAIYTEMRETSSVPDPNTGATRRQGTAKETHADCKWSLTKPTPMTVSGTVQNQFDLVAKSEGEGRFSGTGTMTSKGALTLENPTGKRRSCTVDLTYALTYQTGLGTVKGTFCAVAVSEEIDLTRAGR